MFPRNSLEQQDDVIDMIPPGNPDNKFQNPAYKLFFENPKRIMQEAHLKSIPPWRFKHNALFMQAGRKEVENITEAVRKKTV
ncbi:MAG: hypothetical protein ACD_60C00160G0031 [uncultured bacterium]|nr:MAG: hypothetical protein ACD_60C00160G0031 [uncultured bacterium]